MELARRPVTPPLCFDDEASGARGLSLPQPARAAAPALGAWSSVDREVASSAPSVGDVESAGGALAHALALSQRPITPPLCFDDL